METLHFDQLPQGGFAGLKERQFVTDSRVFGDRKKAVASEGLGNFIYLADASFVPHGETGMHPHHEIDVISVMVDGRIHHEGSLEHGKGLEAGMAQVQRAGGEGFSHNEVNPDNTPNNMIQLWVLPEVKGEQSGYKVYTPKSGERTRIYGGIKGDTKHFYSNTVIEVASLEAGQTVEQTGNVMAFLSKGKGLSETKEITAHTLLQGENLSFKATETSQLILVYTLS
ncbi:MAG: pirin family protein [Endozoicomonas sp.]|uniref:pirin family protein n=1 Tax=Endozoicomonas sp. TaxID=1892382 RepID=UPI003D9BE5C8